MTFKIINDWISKNSDEYSELWDYDAEQQINFQYSWANAEFSVKIKVDLNTGDAKVIEFDGRKLED